MSDTFNLWGDKGIPTEPEGRERLKRRYDEEPRVISEYRILPYGTRGAFAEVRLVERLSDGKERIVRYPRKDILKSKDNPNGLPPKTVQSIFLSEAFLLKEELNHPNIVKCDGWFYDKEDSIYVVTERLDERVDEALVREPSLEKLYKVMKEMASALTHLESKGIVHYDVKPDNIMLDSAGDSRLIDFNIFMIQGEKSSKYRGTHGFTPFQYTPYAHPARDKFGYGMTFTSILLRMNKHSGEETKNMREHLVIGKPYAFETLAQEGVPDSLITGVLARCVESVDEETALAGDDLEKAVLKFGIEQGFEKTVDDVEEAMVLAKAEDRKRSAKRLRA